jgi:hypothetical protein
MRDADDAPVRERLLLVLDRAVDRGTLTYDEALAVLDAFDARATQPGAPRLRPAVPHGPEAHLHGDWSFADDECSFPECPIRDVPPDVGPVECEHGVFRHCPSCTRPIPPGGPLWAHRDGTPCPNISDTWVCDEHGEWTTPRPSRPIPPGQDRP